MHGTGVPVITPFTPAEEVDHQALASLVEWLEASGIDFLVPCGSTGEGPALTGAEATAVVETVVNATDGPVIAGTGREALEPTIAATERAAAAGADGALVITPSYYGHSQSALESYYRQLAESSSIPIYLYSVPKFTDTRIEPSVAATLATHPNVAGIKDSSGGLAGLQRLVHETAEEDFTVLVGHGGIYAPALQAGADGGILALGNVVPELVAEIRNRHRRGDSEGARTLNAGLVELNHAITSDHGVPGVKAATAARGQPAGHPRRPLQSVQSTVENRLATMVGSVVGQD